MLFYWYNDLPKCELNFETVEELLLERFQVYCLHTNLHYDTEEFNYYDKIVHLFMSIIAIDFPYFYDTYMNGELAIFRERMKNKNSSEMEEELSNALGYLITLSQSEELKKLTPKQSKELNLVQNIILTLLSKSSHVFKMSHPVKCRKLKMTLPYTFPLKLVAKREVEVRRGKVSVSCGKWDKIVELVFEYFLQLKTVLMKRCEKLRKVIYESEDDRIRQIIKRFTNLINGTCDKDMKVLKAAEIDVSSQYFPPCMANLHQILRETHRLSYESRYQYTLFLKDIGMSVDENILFWENEYTKPYKGSSCTHEWEDRQKRYIYQIQHLYGLIGTHGFRTSYSCDKFIQPLQSKMDGSCPFQYLTAENLEKVIPKNMMALPDVEDVFKYKNCNMPQKACTAYLNCQLKALCRQRRFSENNMNVNKIIYVTSPLQYYNMAKNLSSNLEI